MRLGVWLAIGVGALGALALPAGCTQDFDQFEPTGDTEGCTADQKPCGGACVARSDPSFGCGDGCEPCEIPNASARCVDGACAVIGCDTGFTDCDLVGSNGCESDTSSDPANCGGCGAACDLPFATAGCLGGVCTVDQCAPGYLDCDGAPANGCEANTSTNPAHCGGCDAPCNPFQTCASGVCTLECSPDGSDADCDGFANNGCETQLGTVDDCAMCGDACAPANGTGACAAGVCVIAACNQDYADCDGMFANGCEANLQTSAMTCGSCTNACPFGPSSIAVCNSGMCGLTCIGESGDCNGIPTDGCEVDTLTSTAHCGDCNRPCSTANVATAICSGGLCTSTCTMGFGNCDQPVSPSADDGCEIDTMTHVDHCGQCDRACVTANVASRSCSAGACNSTCDPGFGNCTQPPAPSPDNGCELNVTQSDTHCGGCFNQCTLQGGPGNFSFECDRPMLGPTQKYCGCSTANECDGDGNGPGGGACAGASGLCQCNNVTCRIGEDCLPGLMGDECSCNGGMACGGTQACCQTPAGCFDLQTSPVSCGACGHACPVGFACLNAACRCDESSDCNAGTQGAFACEPIQGRCVCEGITCAPGERCQPSGQCG